MGRRAVILAPIETSSTCVLWCSRLVKAFRLVGKGRLEEVDAGGVPGSVSDDHHWLDLASPSDDECASWMGELGVPPFLMELALGPFPSDALGNPSSGALVSDEGTYFFFPFFARRDQTIPNRLSGICTRSILITFHDADLTALAAVQRLGQEGDMLPFATVPGAVAALLRFSGARAIETAGLLRKRTSALSNRLTQGENVALQEILELEAQTDILSSAGDELLATVQALSVGNPESLNLNGLERHISATITNLEMLARASDRLDRHVDSLRSQYDSVLTERTNRRLAILTVFSAIFMPLTLIAGIYGMNFEFMPELHAPNAYPTALGAMVLVALGMLAYFWRRGWFD